MSAAAHDRPDLKALAEAAIWMARLRGDAPDTATEADFRAWLRQDAGHAEAFERLSTIWEVSGGLSPDGAAEPAPQAAVPRRAPVFATLALLAACLMGALWWVLAPATIGTDVGEIRTVIAADGSRLQLNTDTRIDVDLSSTRRHIRLRQGEADFEVAKDRTRPFVVSAGPVDITAIGTRFTVRMDKGDVVVRLREGVVSVWDRSQPRHVRLQAGQSIRIAAGRTIQPLADNMAAATAWQRGELVFEDVPLAAALAEANRYSTLKLQTGSAEVGALRVSGVFAAGDSAAFANALADMFDLAVAEQDSAIILEARPGSDAQGVR